MMQSHSQSRPDRRRASIVDAVRKLVAEQGLRFSMDAVAARAGCSKQTLYSHYGSRENLLREVISEHLETITRTLSHTHDDLRTALVQFARVHRCNLADPNTTAIRRLLIAEAGHFAQEAGEFHQTAVGTLLGRLIARLRLAIENGELRPGNVEHMAELLLAMIIGLDADRFLFAVNRPPGSSAGNDWPELAVDAFLRAFSVS